MEGLLNKCGGRVAVAVVVMNVIYHLRTVSLTLKAMYEKSWIVLAVTGMTYIKKAEHGEHYFECWMLGYVISGRMQDFWFVTNIEDFQLYQPPPPLIMFPEATMHVYLDFHNLELHATTGMRVNLAHLDATMEVYLEY